MCRLIVLRITASTTITIYLFISCGICSSFILFVIYRFVFFVFLFGTMVLVRILMSKSGFKDEVLIKLIIGVVKHVTIDELGPVDYRGSNRYIIRHILIS
jgi:hypothetical protein